MDFYQVITLCFCLLALALEICAWEIIEIKTKEDLTVVENREITNPGKMFVLVVDHKSNTAFKSFIDDDELLAEMKKFSNTILYHMTTEIKLPEVLRKKFRLNDDIDDDDDDPSPDYYPLFYLEKHGMTVARFTEEKATDIAKTLNGLLLEWEAFDKKSIEDLISERIKENPTVYDDYPEYKGFTRTTRSITREMFQETNSVRSQYEDVHDEVVVQEDALGHPTPLRPWPYQRIVPKVTNEPQLRFQGLAWILPEKAMGNKRLSSYERETRAMERIILAT